MTYNSSDWHARHLDAPTPHDLAFLVKELATLIDGDVTVELRDTLDAALWVADHFVEEEDEEEEPSFIMWPPRTGAGCGEEVDRG